MLLSDPLQQALDLENVGPRQCPCAAITYEEGIYTCPSLTVECPQGRKPLLVIYLGRKSLFQTRTRRPCRLSQLLGSFTTASRSRDSVA